MLSAKTIREYKQGMYDLYSEVGSTKIKYFPLIVNKSPEDIYGDIYNEPEVSYAEPIYLVGTITPLMPTEDPLLYAVSKDKEIYNIDIVGLSLEKNSLDPFEMTKGQFGFDNQIYTVNKVTPKGMFTDFYTSFVFECERIDK